ncbi:flagellar assembly protein FliW [Quadrisphaera granulorum]|nr:flagellar assembly protein FliW [Quadrisphaera granulorum]
MSVQETTEDQVSVIESTDDAASAPEVRFSAPLLGLEHLTRFALEQVEADSPLFSLRSLEDNDVSLLLLAPDAVFDGYAPKMDAVSRAAVGLPTGDDGIILNVVNAAGAKSLEEATVNLLAPILINPNSGTAAQIVLTGSDYPLRQPLAG